MHAHNKLCGKVRDVHASINTRQVLDRDRPGNDRGYDCERDCKDMTTAFQNNASAVPRSVPLTMTMCTSTIHKDKEYLK